MTAATWTEEDTAKAQRIWAEFLEGRNPEERLGETAGIDPKTGRIWFGASIADIIAQRAAEGLDTPVRFERIGSKTYFKKGGRR